MKIHFSDTGVQVMVWSPQSPDLNPIENLWQAVKECPKNISPRNLDELKGHIKEVWERSNE